MVNISAVSTLNHLLCISLKKAWPAAGSNIDEICCNFKLRGFPQTSTYKILIEWRYKIFLVGTIFRQKNWLNSLLTGTDRILSTEKIRLLNEAKIRRTPAHFTSRPISEGFRKIKPAQVRQWLSGLWRTLVDWFWLYNFCSVFLTSHKKSGLVHQTPGGRLQTWVGALTRTLADW